MYRKNKSSIQISSWRYAIPVGVALLTVGTFFVSSQGTFLTALRTPASAQQPQIFSDHYPVDEDFKIELKNLLDSKSLEPDNEQKIREWTTATASDLEMPQAILWCLFFQESRLQHLTGYNDTRAAKGLGQFLRSTFFEVNKHLDRYTPRNSQTIFRRMGRDIRPVRAQKFKRTDITSYYYIPTAVLSSGSYLNNRYHQLAKNLGKRGISADPQLLWLYSVMAYNKGTRSVLSFWNDAYRKGGNEKVRQLVNDLPTFQAAVQREPNLRRALARIWSPAQAERYAQELRVHLQNVSRCSLESKPLARSTRQTTAEGTF